MNANALRIWEPDTTAAVPSRDFINGAVWEFEDSGSLSRRVVICDTRAEALAVASGMAKWSGSANMGTAQLVQSPTSAVVCGYTGPGLSRVSQSEGVHRNFAGTLGISALAGTLGTSALNPSEAYYAARYTGFASSSDLVIRTALVGASTTMSQFANMAYLDAALTSAFVPENVDFVATIDSIRSATDPQTIDPEQFETAKAASHQAIEFIVRNRLPGRPRVMMSDDGVLTLQWRNQLLGAALIFTGDGTFSVALKNAQHSYSDSVRDDVPLDATLPIELVSTLEAIIG